MNDKKYNLKVRILKNQEKIDFFKQNDKEGNEIVVNHLKIENNKLIKILDKLQKEILN